MIRSIYATTLLIVGLGLISVTEAQTTRYVAMSGSNSGNTCDNPEMECRTITHAVDVADPGDTIHVRAGIYTEQLVIDKALVLEGEDRETTIIEAHRDPGKANGRVITLAGGNFPVIGISGLTIRHGRATSELVFDDAMGGGIFVEPGVTLDISDVVLTENQAGNGGGIGNRSALPVTMSDVLLIDNLANQDLGTTGAGGGMFNHNDSRVVTMTRVSFIGNQALRNTPVGGHGGGGLWNGFSNILELTDVLFMENSTTTAGGGYHAQGADNDISLTNVQFIGNSAGVRGGGMNQPGLSGTPRLVNVEFRGNFSGGIGGGLRVLQASPSLINVTFSGNAANEAGGALSAENIPSSSPMLLTNVIMWNNRAAGQTTTPSASIFHDNSSAIIDHSLIENSGGSVFWNPELGINGGNNIDADPLFALTPNPVLAPTLAGDVRLTADSPAIVAGDNGAVVGIETDLDGRARIFDGTVDLGPYETHFATLAVTVLGDGNVTVEPDKNRYLVGETVVLTAVPGPNQAFHGWSDDASGNANPLAVTLEEDTRITAAFVPADELDEIFSDRFE